MAELPLHRVLLVGSLALIAVGGACSRDGEGSRAAAPGRPDASAYDLYGSRVTGIACDSRGAGLPGVSVRIDVVGAAAAIPDGAASGVTDARGEFNLLVLYGHDPEPSGSVRVRLSHAGFWPATQDVPVGARGYFARARLAPVTARAPGTVELRERRREDVSPFVCEEARP